jgi:serine/threonine protein phosphatase PrpC
MQCPQCAVENPDDDMFCEACGVRLNSTAEPAACACGAAEAEIDHDGYCARCGRRVRRAANDRIETVLSAACAAVCDRGVRHARNEDRAAIEQIGGAHVLVACDGVSASRESELASSAVAAGVADALARALRNGGVHDAESAMRQAIAKAALALEAFPARGADDNPPSTTVAAAMIHGGHVTVGWVGDSRVYWIGGDGARQLTRDHSWMNDIVSAGKMKAEEAAKDPQAHAITRWLGADAGENAAAETARFALTEPGVLLVCTDGLWNYAVAPDAIERLVREANACAGDALDAARSLVDFANAQGGQDNITAIILRWETALP